MSKVGSITPCPGCGVLLPDQDGPTHRYLESSPACWALYGEILAREYSDLRYRQVHRLTVDAFAAQHPGRMSPQTIQSAAVHLISLHHVLERGYTMQQATQAMASAVSKGKGQYVWLTPPASLKSEITVADVLKVTTVEEHLSAVRAWAVSVWHAWSHHHKTIREWAAATDLRIEK